MKLGLKEFDSKLGLQESRFTARSSRSLLKSLLLLLLLFRSLSSREEDEEVDVDFGVSSGKRRNSRSMKVKKSTASRMERDALTHLKCLKDLLSALAVYVLLLLGRAHFE
ncbi:hypothetical protein LguiA_030008 [Lonicera macranthoides]